MRNELHDNQIRLRRYRADDVERMYEAVRESIPELIPWMWWCHQDFSMDESAKWVGLRDKAWEDGEDYDFLIEDMETGAYLGGCGVNRIDSIFKNAEMGYWIRSSRTKRGIVTAAAKLVMRFGFEDLSLIRIEIVIHVDNKASQRVAEKLGALKEATLRNRLFLQGKPQDAVLYSLIPGDIS